MNPQYVYGIVRPKTKGQQTTFKSKPIGKKASAISLLYDESGTMAALISGADKKPFPIKRRNLLAHEEVLTEALSHFDVLPFRFNTIVDSQQQIKNTLSRDFERFEAALNELAGKEEVSVMAYFKQDDYIQKISEQDAAIVQFKKQLNPKTAKRDDLIKVGQMVEKAIAARKGEIQQKLHKALDKVSVDAVVQTPKGDKAAFQAAYLVEQDKIDALEEALEEVATPLADELKFKLNLKLPPYHFIDLRLEE